MRAKRAGIAFIMPGRQHLNRTSLQAFCRPAEILPRGWLSFPKRGFDVRFSLRKSLATKLFRPISSGNRPSQNFFGSFPQEIGRHKTFSAKSLRKSGEKNYFSQKPQEIDCHKRKRRHRGRGAREWNIFRPFAGYCRDFVCLLQKRLYLCRRFMAYVR